MGAVTLTNKSDPMDPQLVHRGRGAQSNVSNRFDALGHEFRDDFVEHCRISGEEIDQGKTKYQLVYPKTIVNKVASPDVGMSFSMNPYQGCEHGCVYCYARNSQEYWGYGPGLDFERIILVKNTAAQLLEQKLRSRTWKAQPIVLSGNTDCYQPAERKFKLTRSCLEVFLRYRHPVGIITKNALVLRDLDILSELAALGLVVVSISVTTLSEETRRILEPRTVSIAKRLETIRELTEHGIPVNAMLAPIIPGINSHEILPMAKAVADHGALSMGYTMVRLNGAIGGIFTDWIRKTLPDRADKVLNQIADCHAGNLSDSRLSTRMRGEGHLADQIKQMVKLSRHKYFFNRQLPKLNTDSFESYQTGQLSLF